MLAALREAAEAGTRIASVCVGAFVLAEAGLLDGLRATTHWAAAEEFAHAYPRVEVEPDVLYVDNGRILTSAGAAAALDLCLHMIRRDFGSAVAANAARMSVMPLEREGGQAQFIVHEHPPVPRGSDLQPLLEWIEDNLSREVTLAAMAARAGMSERTFSRRFREQTGTTPLQWLLRARVRRAQYLLESGDHTVDRIAQQAGFGSVTAFRERFRKVVGTTPDAYRRSFRGGRAAAVRVDGRSPAQTASDRPPSPSASGDRRRSVRARASRSSARATASWMLVVPIVAQSPRVTSASSPATAAACPSACAIRSVAYRVSRCLTTFGSGTST